MLIDHGWKLLTDLKIDGNDQFSRWFAAGKGFKRRGFVSGVERDAVKLLRAATSKDGRGFDLAIGQNEKLDVDATLYSPPRQSKRIIDSGSDLVSDTSVIGVDGFSANRDGFIAGQIIPAERR